jgi:hypothetical protein
MDDMRAMTMMKGDFMYNYCRRHHFHALGALVLLGLSWTGHAQTTVGNLSSYTTAGRTVTL